MKQCLKAAQLVQDYAAKCVNNQQRCYWRRDIQSEKLFSSQCVLGI